MKTFICFMTLFFFVVGSSAVLALLEDIGITVSDILSKFPFWALTVSYGIAAWGIALLWGCK